MKQIGLLGGTSWPSTLSYYQKLNELAADRLGGFHSARLLLWSMDYHDIKSRYGNDWAAIPALLKKELQGLLLCKPECLILCNNTLHKAYDAIAGELGIQIPFFHAAELAAEYARKQGFKRVLLLATKGTMEDGYYKGKLEAKGLQVLIPAENERNEIQAIQAKLAEGKRDSSYTTYFQDVIIRYPQADAAVLACTELPLAIQQQNSRMPLIDPAALQCEAAMAFALS